MGSKVTTPGTPQEWAPRGHSRMGGAWGRDPCGLPLGDAPSGGGNGAEHEVPDSPVAPRIREKGVGCQDSGRPATFR